MRKILVEMLPLLMLALFGNAAYAAEPPPPQFAGPIPVELTVGEIYIVTESIDIPGPLSAPICDDVAVVNVVDTPDGPAFKGITPGKTLCSVAAGPGGRGFRRVFSITVYKE